MWPIPFIAHPTAHFMTRETYKWDPMESPRFHLERAREKYEEIGAHIRRHIDTGPFTMVTEECPTDGMRRTVLRRTKRTPLAVGATVNEAFEHLRKSLDQIGHAVARASGTNGKYSAFPFGNSEAEVRGKFSGQSRQLPPTIQDIVLSFHPFRDGDGLFWATNEIANHSKHRITMAYPSVVSGATIHNFQLTGTGNLLGPWDEDSGEMLIAEVAQDSSWSVGEIKFGIQLVFGEIPVVQGMPIEPVFSHAEGKVAQVLDAIEREAREQGLFTS